MSYPFQSSQPHHSTQGPQLSLTEHERSLIRDKLASILLEYVNKDHGTQNSEPRIREMAFKFEQHIFQTARTRDEYMKTIADKIKQVRQRNQHPSQSLSLIQGGYLSDTVSQQIPSQGSQPYSIQSSPQPQSYYASSMPMNTYGQSSDPSSGPMGGLALPASATGMSTRPSQQGHSSVGSNLLASSSSPHDHPSLQRSPVGASSYNVPSPYSTANLRYNMSHAATVSSNAKSGLGASPARMVASLHSQSLSQSQAPSLSLPHQHTLSPQQMTQASVSGAGSGSTSISGLGGMGGSRGGTGHVTQSLPIHTSALNLSGSQAQQHGMYNVQNASQMPSSSVRQPSQAQYVSQPQFVSANTTQGMVNLASFGSSQLNRFPGQSQSQSQPPSSISGLGITTAAVANAPVAAHSHQRVYSTTHSATSMTRPMGLPSHSHLHPHLQSQSQSQTQSPSHSVMMRPLYGNRALPLATTAGTAAMTTAATSSVSISLPSGLSSLQLNGHEKAQMLSRVEYLKHLLPYTDHLMNTCLKVGQVIPPNALEKLAHVKGILLKQTELIEDGVYILSPTKMESFIGHLKRFMAALIQRLKTVLPVSELVRQQRQAAAAMGPFTGAHSSAVTSGTSDGSHTVASPHHDPSLAHMAASAGLESSLLSDFESSGAFDPDASIIEQLERESESLDHDTMMAVSHPSISSIDMLPARPLDRSKSIDYLNEQLNFALELPENEQEPQALDHQSETRALLNAYMESSNVQSDTLYETVLGEMIQLYDQGYQLVPKRNGDLYEAETEVEMNAKVERYNEKGKRKRLLLLPEIVASPLDASIMLDIELPIGYPKTTVPLGISSCYHSERNLGRDQEIHSLGDLALMLTDQQTRLDMSISFHK